MLVKVIFILYQYVCPEHRNLRGMKTFSSGARINWIVFFAKTAIYSSLALPEMSSYALLYNAIKMFKRTTTAVKSASQQ